jgi:hypothetical protein
MNIIKITIFILIRISYKENISERLNQELTNFLNNSTRILFTTSMS